MKQKFREWKDNIHEWLICAVDEVIEPTYVIYCNNYSNYIYCCKCDCRKLEIM